MNDDTRIHDRYQVSITEPGSDLRAWLSQHGATINIRCSRGCFHVTLKLEKRDDSHICFETIRVSRVHTHLGECISDAIRGAEAVLNQKS